MAKKSNGGGLARGLFGGGNGGGPMQKVGGQAGFLFGLWAGAGQDVMAQTDPKAMLNTALYAGTGIDLNLTTGQFQGWNLWRPVQTWGFALVGKYIGRMVGKAADALGLGSMLTG